MVATTSAQQETTGERAPQHHWRVVSPTDLRRSSWVLWGSRPSPPGAGQCGEAGRGKKGLVAGIAPAGGLLPLQPRVVQEALDLRQPQPVSRLSQQPGCDSAAAMPLGDTQVADVGPPPMPGQPLSLLE